MTNTELVARHTAIAKRFRQHQRGEIELNAVQVFNFEAELRESSAMLVERFGEERATDIANSMSL